MARFECSCCGAYFRSGDGEELPPDHQSFLCKCGGSVEATSFRVNATLKVFFDFDTSENLKERLKEEFNVAFDEISKYQEGTNGRKIFDNFLVRLSFK